MANLLEQEYLAFVREAILVLKWSFDQWLPIFTDTGRISGNKDTGGFIGYSDCFATPIAPS